MIVIFLVIVSLELVLVIGGFVAGVLGFLFSLLIARLAHFQIQEGIANLCRFLFSTWLFLVELYFFGIFLDWFIKLYFDWFVKLDFIVFTSWLILWCSSLFSSLSDCRLDGYFAELCRLFLGLFDGILQ